MKSDSDESQFCSEVSGTTTARVPLGHMADPMELNYLPRREWYFLFLKFFEGPLQVLGTVLPALAILALLLVPLFERAKHDSAKLPNMQKRMHAMALVVLVFLGWGGLTAVAVATTPHSNETDMSALESWQELPAGDLASIGFFRQAKCNTCHAIANQNGGSTSAGPDLTASVSVLPTEWLGEHFRKSSQDLSELQIQLLVRFVTQRGNNVVDAWATAPQSAVEGLWFANDCGSCHKINGVGDDLCPPLNARG